MQKKLSNKYQKLKSFKNAKKNKNVKTLKK